MTAAGGRRANADETTRGPTRGPTRGAPPGGEFALPGAFAFPRRRERLVVETPFMTQVIRRTLLAQPDGGIAVWSGASRLGKTTTGRLLADRINAAYTPDDPDAFRAHYFQAGGVGHVAGTAPAARQRQMKHGIRSLHTEVIGPLANTIFSRDPTEALARRVVDGLEVKAIQLVVVDEAGTLTLEEIRGMVQVRDVAEAAGWPLALVFVGMDDLARTMTRLPQVEGRVHTWCEFAPYDLDDTWRFLSALSPHFRALDRRRPEHRAQAAFVHQAFGGVPGLMVPFLRLLALRLEENPGDAADLLFLQAVHEDMRRAKERLLGAANRRQGRGGPAGAGPAPPGVDARADEAAGAAGHATPDALAGARAAGTRRRGRPRRAAP